MNYPNSENLRKPTELWQLDDEGTEKLNHKVRSTEEIKNQSRLQYGR